MSDEIEREPETSEEDGDRRPPAARTGRREVWVGLFVILGVLSALVALFTFTEPATFRGRYKLSTVVADAGGIRRGDPVQYRGVAVGRIRGFEIAPGGVTIELELERHYRVPRDSTVELSSNALIGGSVAKLVPGESPDLAPDGAVLPGNASRPLPEKFGEVAAESEKTLQRVQDLLSPRTVSGVEGSVEQLQSLLTELAQTTAAQRTDIERTTRSLRRAAENAERLVASPELERSVKRLDVITVELERAATSFDHASSSMDLVMGRIERGEGTLGRLSKDESLYKNANRALIDLNQTSTAVRALALDLNAHPQRYVNLSLF